MHVGDTSSVLEERSGVWDSRGLASRSSLSHAQRPFNPETDPIRVRTCARVPGGCRATNVTVARSSANTTTVVNAIVNQNVGELNMAASGATGMLSASSVSRKRLTDETHKKKKRRFFFYLPNDRSFVPTNGHGSVITCGTTRTRTITVPTTTCSSRRRTTTIGRAGPV